MVLGILRKIELALESIIEGNPILKSDNVEPLDLVKQIESQIEKNKKVFINNKIYVAHKIVINLYAPTPEKIEEYEALFHSQPFVQHVEEYVKSRGYDLLDKIRIVIKCHTERKKEFGRKHCYLEFYWPTPEADPGDVTIRINKKEPEKIEEVSRPEPEVGAEAYLEAIEGEVYEKKYRLTKKATYLGRMEQIVDRRTNQTTHKNDFVFAKGNDEASVNNTVSRRHAKIVYAEGKFYLYDTGSENGTAVERDGGSKVALKPRTPEGEKVVLENNDVIRLGDAKVKFTISR
jgi:hypothetical protein